MVRTEEEKQNQELNMRKKIIARQLKEKDKQETTKSKGRIVTACYDFQKRLNCPHGNVGLCYYKRKLSFITFS